ncbi:AP2-associated protein kinase 1 [Collichthys lucidus]|uniref:AP2-associated protein kinase 1 n=1 Tax=Collichthys lucidus TaxID=240159 RepID=A0A4U5V9H9_COLLU|nr:AP2-associated protein kinase 1 [Collichthys lucidus]
MINKKANIFVARLTDPIPTTETSITPRQRPKAAHTQPTAGILPIQPAALTPRKRANLPWWCSSACGLDLSQPAAALQSQKAQTSVLPLIHSQNNSNQAATPQKQPVQPAESTTAAAVVPAVTKADVQPQAQPVQQQTTPSSVVSAASQQAAQTPSSPAPPQRPARRKQAGQAQQPAAQPSPSKPSPGQPPVSVQQQMTQPAAAQAQPASAEVSQKAAETTPPASPKTTEERGHQRIPSDATASSFAGAAVSHFHLNQAPRPSQLGVADAGQDQSKAGDPVLAPGGATNASAQPAWNPFDDDDFSNLTAEEFKSEDKKPADLPSEVESTCDSGVEELIPGLHASTVDNTPQETVERPSAILDVDSGASLLIVPDPFCTLDLSDTPEKLIEGLKSPDTSSLMLPDLLSLSDPFGGAVEESAKDHLHTDDSLLGCSLISGPSAPPAASSTTSSISSAPTSTASALDDFNLLSGDSTQPKADSSLLISDFEPQQASADVGTEDEFDPIPVTGRKNSQGESLRSPQVSGGHSRSNSGGSESSLPSLARSLLLVDQLIDLWSSAKHNDKTDHVPNIRDLQRELSSNVQRAAVAPVQFTEENQIEQKTSAACVYNKHTLPSDGKSIQHNTTPATSTSVHFIPTNQVFQFQPPVTSDVFQLAPFKTPGKESKMAFSSSSLSPSRKPAETSDVFLQAPFGKRQETAKAVPSNTHILKSGTQQIQPTKQCHLVPVSSPPAPQCLGMSAHHVHTERPLLQQPVVVHRVVSRIGQQAAVGSVAVGPLHAWTIGGRALEDPFTAAPFQPRYSQGKP